MQLIPIEGEEEAISIANTTELVALLGTASITYIGVSGGRVLAFSDESPIEKDGEIVYPARNNRASRLRGRRVVGNAVLGVQHEFEFDKYEAIETMMCAQCGVTIPWDDCNDLCDHCGRERKRTQGVTVVVTMTFAMGCVFGFGLSHFPSSQPAPVAQVQATAPVQAERKPVQQSPLVTSAVVTRRDNPVKETVKPTAPQTEIVKSDKVTIQMPYGKVSIPASDVRDISDTSIAASAAPMKAPISTGAATKPAAGLEKDKDRPVLMSGDVVR